MREEIFLLSRIVSGYFAEVQQVKTSPIVISLLPPYLLKLWDLDRPSFTAVLVAVAGDRVMLRKGRVPEEEVCIEKDVGEEKNEEDPGYIMDE